MVNINNLQTEQQNPHTRNIDRMSLHEILVAMNEEDQKCSKAVAEALPEIEKAVAHCTETLKKGGRIVYAGAGTSGRIGLMDAVECLPTFSSEQVIAIMAGGENAFVRAVEGAEDSKTEAKHQLEALELCSQDVLVGISASGRTPFVIGALETAKTVGADTVAISCNKHAEMSSFADVAIEVDAGPEILTGSTRLKSGTCQKLILNMISTASMILNGKVYDNLMVDLKATNKKLEERSIGIVMKSANVSRQEAEAALNETKGSCKEAITMLKLNVTADEAKIKLDKAGGFVYRAVNEV